jgi:hypothetical protein
VVLGRDDAIARRAAKIGRMRSVLQ